MAPERRSYQHSQRIALRQHTQLHPQLKQKDLVEWFKHRFGCTITQGIVSSWLAKKDAPSQRDTCRRHRTQKWPELEAALIQWFLQNKDNIPISDHLLKVKAECFWNALEKYQGMEVPQFSNGWLQGFKKRHNITRRIRHGEIGGLNQSDIQQQPLAVRAIVRQCTPSDDVATSRGHRRRPRYSDPCPRSDHLSPDMVVGRADEPYREGQTRRRRLPISSEQRLALRRHAFSNPHLKQLQLAAWFKDTYGHPISQGTISESLSERFKRLDTLVLTDYEAVSRRGRRCEWPRLEEALYEWYVRCELAVPVSDKLLRHKAGVLWRLLPLHRSIDVPQFSNGWIQGFKRRHNLRPSLQDQGAGSLEVHAPEHILAVQAVASQFHPRDVYNCDETRLFWKALPESDLSSTQPLGSNQREDHFTAHFACNADGSDKLPLWFVGCSTKPRAFSAAAVNIGAFDCHYRSNGTASMTTVLMTEWLWWFDRRMTGRKVLLLMNLLTSHRTAHKAVQLSGQPLQNIVVCWLPVDATLGRQPLDQGIIYAFKAHYRRRWLNYVIDQYETEGNPLTSMNILKAIRWSSQAWRDLVPGTIADCWRHSMVFAESTTPSPPLVNMAAEAVAEVSSLINRLRHQRLIARAMTIEAFLNPEREKTVDIADSEELGVAIAAQFEPQPDHEPDEELELVPRVSTSEAIAALHRLCRYEEQQDDGDCTVIAQLNSYEALLRARNQQP